jgi:hypothetical protein
MLTDHWAAAAICAGLVALAVAGWHRQQPYHHETV